MTVRYDYQDLMSLDREIEDQIAQVVMSCGPIPLKEKVSLLFLVIDYIFAHNEDIMPSFEDEITLH